MRFINPRHNNSDIANIYLRGTDLKALHKLLHTPKKLRLIPVHSLIIPLTTDEEAMCSLHRAQKTNKAIILGCKNLRDLQECEEYLNSISNNPNFYTWYKKRDGGKWVIQLIFPNLPTRTNIYNNASNTNTNHQTT